MKIWQTKSLKTTLHAALIITMVNFPAYAQQMNGRDPYEFQVIKNPTALARAVAIDQKKHGGFGIRQNVRNTITTNTSNAIGTLTEVQAILEGDNSDLNLTSTNSPTNSGTQTSTSNQNQ
jgi:hypothetical protein